MNTLLFHEGWKKEFFFRILFRSPNRTQSFRSSVCCWAKEFQEIEEGRLFGNGCRLSTPTVAFRWLQRKRYSIVCWHGERLCHLRLWGWRTAGESAKRFLLACCQQDLRPTLSTYNVSIFRHGWRHWDCGPMGKIELFRPRGRWQKSSLSTNTSDHLGWRQVRDCCKNRNGLDCYLLPNS